MPFIIWILFFLRYALFPFLFIPFVYALGFGLYSCLACVEYKISTQENAYIGQSIKPVTEHKNTAFSYKAS